MFRSASQGIRDAQMMNATLGRGPLVAGSNAGGGSYAVGSVAGSRMSSTQLSERAQQMQEMQGMQGMLGLAPPPSQQQPQHWSRAGAAAAGIPQQLPSQQLLLQQQQPQGYLPGPAYGQQQFYEQPPPPPQGGRPMSVVLSQGQGQLGVPPPSFTPTKSGGEELHI